MPKNDFNEIQVRVIKIALRHVYSPVNLLHTFRTPSPKNISGVLLHILHANRLLSFSINITRREYWPEMG